MTVYIASGLFIIIDESHQSGKLINEKYIVVTVSMEKGLSYVV